MPISKYKVGRPVMDLLKILVLGTLRLNYNWDFDKVHEMPTITPSYVKCLDTAKSILIPSTPCRP